MVHRERALAHLGLLIAVGLGLASGCRLKGTGTTPAEESIPELKQRPRDTSLRIDNTAPVPPPEQRTAPVTRHGQLSVQGAKLVDSSGQPVVLRGQAFGWDNWWPQYYNADVVGWLRDDWCVDIVRPAMGIEPDGAYLSNPEQSKSHVTAVVDAAVEVGVYVIIDWHAHDLHQEEAVAFFSEMAERYGDKPHVLYEIFNEPEQDETWPQVKEYATAVIGAIREHDPDNLVIVGTPEWAQRIDAAAADPLQGQTNVLYSVHFYAATHGQWLRDRTRAAIDKGIPVMVTESSGPQASGQGKNNYTEWNAWFDFMEKTGISWLNYSVSDKAGETISVLEPGASASGGWSDAELTESGEQVRALLRSHCR
jgi:endoglucanase